MDIDSFSNAIALVYDAALDIERWDDALAYIAGLFGTTRAQISFASSIADLPFVRLWGFKPEELVPLLPKYQELTKQDPRFSSVWFKALHCRQVVSEESLHASEMYRQVLGPIGVEYSMYFQLQLAQEEACVLSVMRGPEGKPFTEADCADFGRLVPHIQRALTIHGTFRRARQHSDAARHVIDDLPLGVLIIDDDRVVLANRIARSLLDEGKILKAKDGEIQERTKTGATLFNALREAKKSPTDTLTGMALEIEDNDKIRALIRPLRSVSSIKLGVDESAVAVYLSDSRREVETPEEVMQQLYGLTPREAAVLCALVQGNDLQAISKRFGIGTETVKTHVKRIMRAAGVHRQAELVKSVLSSPAWIARQSHSKSSN